MNYLQNKLAEFDEKFCDAEGLLTEGENATFIKSFLASLFTEIVGEIEEKIIKSYSELVEKKFEHERAENDKKYGAHHHHHAVLDIISRFKEDNLPTK